MSTTSEHSVSFVNDGFALQFILRQAPAKSANQKAIILLHGTGSNEKDLFSLASQFPDNWLIISPRAPYKIKEGSYAWYQVDFSTGQPIINATQEEQSRKILVGFIEQVKEAYMADEIYLGGFSQGAIMSYSVGLTHPGLVKGLFLLSGRILPEIKPLVKKGKAFGKLKVFIAHGIMDTTLPVAFSREARQYLQLLGVPISYHEYTMGHQVSQEVVQDITAWLEEEHKKKIEEGIWIMN